MEILKVENLTFAYPLCSEPAVKDVSFTVERGDFVAVCGATGSGKSTLLRMLKRELIPAGERTGSIYIRGILQQELPDDVSACSIGYVMQKPEQQLVTDKVWHELAFGLENMNVPQKAIARRVAEMAAYFGIEEWYDKRVSELSGGQKQLLNLAAVMVMQPDILILDEPTAQLDPIAASDFIATIKKINRELSLTILIAEHRLEEIIPVSDKLLVVEDGQLFGYDTPEKVIGELGHKPELLCAMPAATRLYHAVKRLGADTAAPHGSEADDLQNVRDKAFGRELDRCPIDIREGRAFIEANFGNEFRSLPDKPYAPAKTPAVQFKDVYLRYEKNQPDVLSGLNLTVYENEICCILGGNGSGKTTMLGAAADVLKIYNGTIKILGKKFKEYKNQSLYRQCLSLLPQDVQTIFLKNTVREELADAQAEVERLPFDITYLYDKHPYDLSGGEQQLVALAKILATRPKVLLLDEPTKGLDAHAKLGIIEILKDLKAAGMTIIAVTHDVEFAALLGDRCAMFFRGNIVSEGTPAEFFSENSFYTTAASRMSRGYYDGAVTVEELAELCCKNATVIKD